MKTDLCHDCGRCCMTQESPPMYIGYLPGNTLEHVRSADARRVKKLPPALRKELEDYVRNMKAGIHPPHPTYPACLWYDAAAKRCKHHELRPDICREFDVGNEHCNKYRREAGLVQLSVNGGYNPDGSPKDVHR